MQTTETRVPVVGDEVHYRNPGGVCSLARVLTVSEDAANGVMPMQVELECLQADGMLGPRWVAFCFACPDAWHWRWGNHG